MLKQRAKLITRFVYFVDLPLTAIAFLAALLIRDLLVATFLPQYFPTGQFSFLDYLRILPLALASWSILLAWHHSYHRHVVKY